MSASLTWLGQAGYILRAPSGAVCLIDPYLSDYVERELGVQRIAPIVCSPTELRAELVLITHWHPDHLDPLTCRPLLAGNPELVFAGPASVLSRLHGWGVPTSQTRELAVGGSVDVGGFRTTATFARHEVPGWIAEDAVGVVVEAEDFRLYHTGDTEYDARLVSARTLGPFDIGLFVTNGTGGNMNSREAALLAHQLELTRAVPMHYGMWADPDYGADATLDPSLFVETCARLGGPPTAVLELGVPVEIALR